jgi:hypothetical protein
MLEHKPGANEVVVELSQCVATVGPVPNDHDAVGANVGTDAAQDTLFGSWRDKGHDVASHDRGVERFVVASGSKVELGEVRHDPGRAAMVRLGSRDEQRVDIHTDDKVPPGSELTPDSPWTAAGVEDPGSRCNDRIQQPCLAGEVYSLAGHASEPVDVPLRVVWRGFGEPARPCSHMGKLDRQAFLAGRREIVLVTTR